MCMYILYHQDLYVAPIWYNESLLPAMFEYLCVSLHMCHVYFHQSVIFQYIYFSTLEIQKDWATRFHHFCVSNKWHPHRGNFKHQIIQGVVGCTPIPTYPYGKSLYKPYITWVFMDEKFPKNPIREHQLNTMGTRTLGVPPVLVPWNHTTKSKLLLLRWHVIQLIHVAIRHDYTWVFTKTNLRWMPNSTSTFKTSEKKTHPKTIPEEKDHIAQITLKRGCLLWVVVPLLLSYSLGSCDHVMFQFTYAAPENGGFYSGGSALKGVQKSRRQ